MFTLCEHYRPVITRLQVRTFLILILFSRIVFFFRKTTKKIEMFFTISISYLNCYIAEKLVCYTLQERPLLLANSRSSLS